MRLGIAATMMLTAMLLLAGCDGHSRRASARLRTENAAMQQQIETLQARQTELEATLATVESEHEVNAEALGQMPQVAGLMVSPLSGFEPTDDDASLRLELHVSAPRRSATSDTTRWAHGSPGASPSSRTFARGHRHDHIEPRSGARCLAWWVDGRDLPHRCARPSSIHRP